MCLKYYVGSLNYFSAPAFRMIPSTAESNDGSENKLIITNLMKTRHSFNIFKWFFFGSKQRLWLVIQSNFWFQLAVRRCQPASDPNFYSYIKWLVEVFDCWRQTPSMWTDNPYSAGEHINSRIPRTRAKYWYSKTISKYIELLRFAKMDSKIISASFRQTRWPDFSQSCIKR